MNLGTLAKEVAKVSQDQVEWVQITAELQQDIVEQKADKEWYK
jgi:hypothetical protein